VPRVSVGIQGPAVLERRTAAVLSLDSPSYSQDLLDRHRLAILVAHCKRALVIRLGLDALILRLQARALVLAVSAGSVSAAFRLTSS
jgi:hypothetical protein